MTDRLSTHTTEELRPRKLQKWKIKETLQLGANTQNACTYYAHQKSAGKKIPLSPWVLYAMCCMLSHFSRVWLFVTLWTANLQVPLSMRSSRQEYWSGVACPPPGDLPDPGTEPVSLTSPALAGGNLDATSATCEAPCMPHNKVKRVRDWEFANRTSQMVTNMWVYSHYC